MRGAPSAQESFRRGAAPGSSAGGGEGGTALSLYDADLPRGLCSPRLSRSLRLAPPLGIPDPLHFGGVAVAAPPGSSAVSRCLGIVTAKKAL